MTKLYRIHLFNLYMHYYFRLTKFNFMDIGELYIITLECFRKIRFPFMFIAGSAQFCIQLYYNVQFQIVQLEECPFLDTA